MKNFFRFLLSFIFVLSSLLHAQNTKNIKAQTQSPAPSIPLLQPEANDVKGRFIEDQNYLFSASSFKDYNRFYGDSLNGFDEAGIKASLVGHNVYGKEYLGHIGRLKREYINQKYNIGFTAQNNQTSSSPISYGRPIGGGNIVINNAPCVNEDFESTLPSAYNTGNAVTGWVISSRSRTACNFTGAFTAGSPEFSIVATPVLNILPSGNVLNATPLGTSPLGGTNVALLNDQVANSNELETKMSQTFPVTSANTLFQFSFAGLWQDGGHACCEQPALQINMFSCTGAPLACSSLSLNAYGLSCLTGATGYSTTNNGWSWTNWQTRFIDLSPYIGTCVTIEFSNSDCIFGGHAGSVYIDARCGGSSLIGTPVPPTTGGPIPGPVSFCAGSNQALINAPIGYSTYQWYGPGSPPVVMSPTAGGNTPVLTVNNPVAGAVYTVQLVSASGCTFTALDTLKFTNVAIVAIGSSSTCPGGANGTATVVGNGSGSGYNYNWYPLNSNVSIGTSSIVTGLAAGIYSVNISGLGSAGCGSAAATVTVGVGPPNVYSIVKPFCGNEAYLSSSGTNFQWYGGVPLAAISSTAGGTSYSLTAPSPYNGQIYWLTYTTLQGCRDSVQFILSQSPPGNMYVTGVSYACPGVANATANIVINPASGAPPGINSYSVFSTSPAYSASLFPTSQNSYTALNMPAGTYSVIGFDGSCKYNTTFTVNDYVYSYVLSPTSSTLCNGNTLLAGASFNTPITLGQYNFQWSPSTFIVGGPVNTTNISVQIAPVIPSGSIVTTIYSLTVVPTIVNCPITQTISVTAVNLQTPTFTVPAEFCNNASPKTITVSTNPVPGVFSTGMGTWLGAGSGIITPPLTAVGTNTFMYTVSVSTCAVSNTGSFIVSKFNTAALTGTISNQCVTNPCINLMGIVQSTVNGYWEGAGVSLNTFCPSSFTAVTIPSVASTSTLTYNTSSSPNPTLCPDTRTLVVSVSHTVAPIIAAQPPFCTNRPSFSMSVAPSGGNWSSSTALLITPAGIVNPANALIGNTQLTYVVTTGACQNLATTTISAVQFHSAALTGSISNLCTNSAPVNLMSIVASPINGTWVGDNVTSTTPNINLYNYISNNIFNPSPPVPGVNPLPTGTYTLHYNTTSTPVNVCPDTRSITVFVLNPPTPTITAVVPHCNADAPFQLLVTPTTGSFTPTVFLTAGGLFTPSLAMVGNNTVQYVIGTSTCNVSDTKLVSVEAFVAPTITGSVPDQCNTNAPVDLAPITLNSTGGWLGSGILGSSFYPTSSGSGIIVLTYTTASLPSGLCAAQATLAVNVFSLATPIIDDEGPYCNSKAPIQLKVTPVGGVFSGQNNSAVNALGRFSPSSAMIGDNIINYSVTAGPCVAYGQTTISIEKFISADFLKYAGPFCRNDVPFDINGIVQNPGGDFTGPGMTGSLFTPANANIGNNNLIIYKTHSMPTASLCPDTSAVRIQVNDIPDVSAVAGPQKGCSPVEVTFSSPNGGAGKGEWTLGDGSDPMTGLTVIHTYTAAGTYSAVFNYWDEIGCTAQKLVDPIVVYPSPKADFTYGPYDELTISDPQVQFTNLSTVLGKNTYEWQIGDLYTLTDVSPQVTFQKIGKYEITLTATTINNCKDKISRVIEIKNDFGVYIPNSFTPNDDGLNDVFAPVFSPYGLDAKTFDMEIFDRWGTSLYHTRDVTKGWDGTVQNKGGDRLKQDVYVYKIKYKDMDGLIYNKLGHVTLLR